MANRQQVARLTRGVETWNTWRGKNPRVAPDLREVAFSNTDFTGINLSGTNLTGAVLHDANLTGAVLSRTLLRGTDLRGADLHETHLNDADLSWAKLTGADLRRADLRRADLHQAILTDANLTDADLSGATLKDADLSRADFTGANLGLVTFTRAIFTKTTFTRAHFDTTIVTAVDLRDVQGLDTVDHLGPSSIGIDTLYKSGGDIPESFLRGCGVPNSMIEYARSLVIAERPIDYYSCFISYSSHDEALAQRLHADLQARGVRCWYAPHDIPIGGSIIDHIEQAIRLHEKLLLILSESSVASRWVEAETKTAIMRERNEGRTVLFPIRLDDAVMQSAAGWAAQLHERQIGDFCQWKDHDAYTTAFARLLRDLRAGASS